MTWFDWTLIGWLALGIFASIALVGAPRKPLTGGTALATLVINGLIIAGLVVTRT